jgi:ATP-binding cassette subfamily B protein
MFDPDSGQILFDGMDLKKLDLQDLRSQISYVPQDVFLFSDTIVNNIKFGMHHANDEQVEKAARQASVDGEIRGFSSGYQTMVGERGYPERRSKQRFNCPALIKNLVSSSSMIV